MENQFYLLDTLNIGVAIIDDSSTVIFVNQWIVSKQVQRQELQVGVNLLESLKGESYESVLGSLNSLLEFGQATVLSPKLNTCPFSFKFGETDLVYTMIFSKLSPDSKFSTIQFYDNTAVLEREKYLVQKQKEFDQQVKKMMAELSLEEDKIDFGFLDELVTPLQCMQLKNRNILGHLSEGKTDDIQKIVQDNQKIIDQTLELIYQRTGLDKKTA